MLSSEAQITLETAFTIENTKSVICTEEISLQLNSFYPCIYQQQTNTIISFIHEWPLKVGYKGDENGGN